MTLTRKLDLVRVKVNLVVTRPVFAGASRFLNHLFCMGTVVILAGTPVVPFLPRDATLARYMP